MPALYVVATPIGNLEDITLRAIRVLKEVKLIAAEDTRKTKRLLSAYDIKTPATSYHEHNKLTKLEFILERLETDDIALVSDAGMPGISDPGYELILAAHERHVPVIPIPGPSVIITGLVVSGLPTDKFLYLGFLPHRKGERQRLLRSVENVESTLVVFESPHRVPEALKDIWEIMGDRRLAVCREMTKIYEEVFRGRVSEAIAHFKEPRGEFTLIIAGQPKAEKPGMSEDTIDQLKDLRRSGLSAREAVARLSGVSGISRKELYRSWININKGAN